MQEVSLPVRLGSSSKRALSPQPTVPNKRYKIEEEDDDTVPALLGPSQVPQVGEEAASPKPAVSNEDSSAPEFGDQRPDTSEPVPEPVGEQGIVVTRYQEGRVCPSLS